MTDPSQHSSRPTRSRLPESPCSPTDDPTREEGARTSAGRTWTGKRKRPVESGTAAFGAPPDGSSSPDARSGRLAAGAPSESPCSPTDDPTREEGARTSAGRTWTGKRKRPVESGAAAFGPPPDGSSSPDARSSRLAPSRIAPLAAALVALAIAVGLPTVASAQQQGDDLPDLSGQWAQKVVQTSITKLPLVGKVTSQTISYLVFEATQEGDRVTWSPTTCDVRIDSDVDVVRTVLPDKFVDAVPSLTRTGRILPADGQGNGPRLEIEPATMVMGANLRSPTHESLPNSSDARPVVDGDRDGHPGVTIRIEGMLDGKMYIVQRGTDSYTAALDGDGRRIRGLVDWKAERSVLKSTNPLIGSGPETNPPPKAERSWFEMVRLDEKTSCSEMMSRRKELFGN